MFRRLEAEGLVLLFQAQGFSLSRFSGRCLELELPFSVSGHLVLELRV